MEAPSSRSASASWSSRFPKRYVSYLQTSCAPMRRSDFTRGGSILHSHDLPNSQEVKRQKEDALKVNLETEIAELKITLENESEGMCFIHPSASPWRMAVMSVQFAMVLGGVVVALWVSRTAPFPGSAQVSLRACLSWSIRANTCHNRRR